MTPGEVARRCRLDTPGRALLDATFERLELSAATLHRVLRVARTIADLAGAERLGAAHVAEAVQYLGAGWVTGLGSIQTPRPMVRVPPAGPRPLAALPEAVGGGP